LKYLKRENYFAPLPIKMQKISKVGPEVLQNLLPCPRKRDLIGMYGISGKRAFLQ
jgi:hypothetical protein